MKKEVFWIFAFIIITSCKSDTKLSDKYSLSKFDSLKLVLDESTGYFHNYIRTLINSDNQIVSFVNEVNNSVYYYDLEVSNMPNKIKLVKEGNDGVGALNSSSSILFVN